MPPTPHINGLVETALYVTDLIRSEQFYVSVLGFREIFQEKERLHALAIAPGQVLLLFRAGASTEARESGAGVIPAHDARGEIHLAFSIDAADIPAWREHLAANDVQVESEVECPRGGHSIYFRDPDRHLVELITPGCWDVY